MGLPLGALSAAGRHRSVGRPGARVPYRTAWYGTLGQGTCVVHGSRGRYRVGVGEILARDKLVVGDAVRRRPRRELGPRFVRSVCGLGGKGHRDIGYEPRPFGGGAVCNPSTDVLAGLRTTRSADVCECARVQVDVRNTAGKRSAVGRTKLVQQRRDLLLRQR